MSINEEGGSTHTPHLVQDQRCRKRNVERHELLVAQKAKWVEYERQRYAKRVRLQASIHNVCVLSSKS